MAQAVYTTGPVENTFSATDTERVKVRVLNRNTTGNASVTVRVVSVSGTRTLISNGQQTLTVAPNAGSTTGEFNTQPVTAYEVVIIVNHPSNVENVLVSVWGLDDVDGTLHYGVSPR